MCDSIWIALSLLNELANSHVFALHARVSFTAPITHYPPFHFRLTRMICFSLDLLCSFAKITPDKSSGPNAKARKAAADRRKAAAAAA
jgi:hypothetical protein